MQKLVSDRILIRGFYVSLKVMLILLALYAVGAWDLPFLSQRNRGDNDFEAGRFTLAIEHYLKAVEQQGNDWELHYNLGTAYYRTGDYQSAVDELKIASQLAERGSASDTNRGKILHNQGLAYLQMDDCENAVRVLTEAAEFAGPDDDIQTNFRFAEQYCAEDPPDPEKSEGEEENEGEGDDEDDEQGQNDEGESNDETEAQDESDAEEGDQDQGGENENQDNNEGDREDDAQDQQEGQDEGQDQSDDGTEQSRDEQEGEGDEDSDDSSDTGSENESENEGEDEKPGGDEDSDDEQRGQGGNADERGPNEIPNDGLNMSDATIQDILDWMANRERMNAPRYFNNHPADGDFLDDESLADLLYRLFYGKPAEDADDLPDDGIDW